MGSSGPVGRSSCDWSIYGLDRPEAGEFLVEGKPLRSNRPSHAIRRGLGLAPEDRKSQALVLDWSETKNVTIADLNRFRVCCWTCGRSAPPRTGSSGR